MSNGETPEERWDNDELNELWAEIQANQSVPKSNGVDGIGAVLETVGSLRTTVEQYAASQNEWAAAQTERARRNSERIDRHSIALHGFEAIEERLAAVLGMVTKIAKWQERLAAALESLQYWLWTVLVLTAFAVVAVLFK